MARKRLLHTHTVSSSRLFNTAWSSGVFSVVWSFFMGAWILRYYGEMFDTESWSLLLDVIDGRKYVIGGVILAGGTLGLAGLIFRIRALSIASCFIGIGWCAWIASFLWVSPANVGAGFATLGCSVFIHRFALLIGPDKNDAQLLSGW